MNSSTNLRSTYTADAPSAETSAPENRSVVRYLAIGCRLLQGLIFFVFGLNGFLNFIPPPATPFPPPVAHFMSGLFGSGYFIPLLAGTELVCGTLLLVNRFVPLALAVLAPVLVNILSFHVFLWREGLGIAVLVCALEAYLAWSYRRAFRTMLCARNPLP